ncbi:hypothetical protein LCGC14_2217760, partial [marine sediment metagenome]
MALRPNIPDVSLVEDPLVREALQAIKRIIDIREGVVGEETFVQKNSLQSGQQTNGAGWVKVTFPKAFTVIPKLVVSGVKDDSTSPDLIEFAQDHFDVFLLRRPRPRGHHVPLIVAKLDRD